MPELVHRDRRRLDRGTGVLEEDDMLLGAHAGHQGGAAVLEQQHDRGAVLQPEQMAPADAHGARPQAGILGPEGESGRRRAASPVIMPELGRIELDAVVAAGVDHRQQARIDRRGFPAADLQEAGIPTDRLRRTEIRTGGADDGQLCTLQGEFPYRDGVGHFVALIFQRRSRPLELGPRYRIPPK